MVIEDGNIIIEIKDEVVQKILSYCQNDSNFPEAGGILAGRENISNDNIIIEYFTQPMDGDYRRRNRFTRKDLGHIIYFENIYNESDGTIGYIGEWHTHSEDVPSYSCLDFKNWLQIRRHSHSCKPQYHFIVGKKAICVWKVCQEHFFPEKIAEISLILQDAMENRIEKETK